MGLAGTKAMALVRGEADIYLHTGGQYAWHIWAPAAVALHVSRVEGWPALVKSGPDVLPLWQPR
jgi:3'(2'), 5'-bisphosphate nucleotidase